MGRRNGFVLYIRPSRPGQIAEPSKRCGLELELNSRCLADVQRKGAAEVVESRGTLSGARRTGGHE